MKLRDLKILFAFFWTIIALSSQAVAQHPSSLSLNEAKLKLEKLRKEYDQINQTFEKDIENQVFTNFGANEKGEFETTKEFDARRAKARVSRLKVAAEKEPLRLSRRIETWVQIDALLDMNFPRSAKATLGLYNADSEKFPIQVEVDGSKFEEFIFVPRPEAQALKEKFSKCSSLGFLVLR